MVSCYPNLVQSDEFCDMYFQLWKVKISFGNIYSLKSNLIFTEQLWNVNYGFCYLILTKHKIRAWGGWFMETFFLTLSWSIPPLYFTAAATSDMSVLLVFLQGNYDIDTVRHVTGNDQDYLRKIPRVVVQKSALL